MNRRLLRFFVSLSALGLSLGCARSVSRPLSEVARPMVYSNEFAIVAGFDTLAFELVTRCPGKLIADQDSRKPIAHVHYQAELGPDGIPAILTISIWDGAVPITGPATQRALYLSRGDTAITEVWKGNLHQVQKYRSARGSYPYLSNYVGLLVQLIQVLGERTERKPTLPVFFVGTDGHAGTAAIDRQSRDSLILAIDSERLRAAWSSESGFLGGKVENSEIRFVRTSMTEFRQADARCGGSSAARLADQL